MRGRVLGSVRGRMLGSALVLALAATGLGTATLQAHAAGATIYVDPVHGNDGNPGTSSGAAFRSLAKAESVHAGTVLLMPGMFDLPAPLTLTSADNNSTWRAYDPAHPPLISAERDIGPTPGHGWSYNPALRVWSLGGVTNLNTRDLWVNGQRATRVHSCLPGEACGAHNTPPGMSLTANGVSALPDAHAPVYHLGGAFPYRNPSSVEFVYRFDGQPGLTGVPWTEPRCDVAGVQGGTEVVMDPCFVTGREENPGGPFRISLPTSIENAFELFDPVAAGNQWYWDPSTAVLSWQAPPGVPGPPSSVIAGGLNGTLVKISSASNITFSNIVFGYTTWTDPSGPGGMIDMQTGLPQTLCGRDCTYPKVPPAAVMATYSSGINLTSDLFTHLGVGAAELGTATNGSTITGSTFQDIGGTGVLVGTTDAPSSATPAAASDTVSNNTFTTPSGWAVGAQYRSSPAIWAGYTSHLQVTGNRICPGGGACALPNAGIAIGWGFGSMSPTSGVGNNTIAQNVVMNSMQWLWDGSPIYSLGDQPGELIRGNVVRNALQTPGGIYIDQAQAGVTLLDNIVENVRNHNDPFTGPMDEPAAAVYMHTCSSGSVTVLDTFSDASTPTTVQNDSGGCHQSASVTVRGAFIGLPHSAMPASLCLCGSGPGPAAPTGVSGSSHGLMTESISGNVTGGVTGLEVQQHDPTYGTIVVGASPSSPVVTADPSFQLTYADRLFARNAAGGLSPGVAVTVVG